ncbi:hypothetical protein A5664_18030 [Mycolicibacterium fortuitum]|nr:hypothetical protein A5664_18030 [Mycolicibacterium fortuitum]
MRDYVLARRIGGSDSPGSSGYSDGELRRLTTRLRQDVASIRDRIEAGMSMIERYEQDPDALEPEFREHARVLVEIASTGVVPDMSGSVATRVKERRRLAMQLFLVPSDLVPLSALFVVLSHRNVETIKELPSTYRVIEDRAVEVTLVKRRRGPNHWFETVNWEIGPPGEDLHHPGALFLMVQRLTALSRRFSGAQRLWSVWRNGWHRAGVRGADEHFDPFTKHLQWPSKVGDWSDAQSGLWADQTDGEQLMPLRLDCVRLKKSMEVRRIKQMGGHLPSAARSNTYSVLYTSYLRDEATVRDWADDVVAGALTDAEEAAWQSHREILRRAGDHLTVVGGEPSTASLEEEGIETASAQRITAGEHDTAWTACADPNQHPTSGKPCRTPSVLDCFHCGNCVVTRDHLPRLLALLDAMQQRRALISEELWWRRYGPSWVAIRRDIIDGRHFTAAEIEQARTLQPDDAMLDLVENPWENNP